MTASVISHDAHSAGRGAIVLLVLQTVSRLLSLAFIIVATHTLVPRELGRYSTVAAALVLAGFLSDFGTTTAATKLVAAGRDADALLSDSLVACGLLGTIGWIAGLCGFAAAAYPHRTIEAFMVLGLTLPADAAATTVFGTLDGSGRIATRSRITFARGAAGAILSSLLLLATSSITVALWGFVAASWVGLGAALATARRGSLWRGKVRLNPHRGLPLVAAALPFAAISGFSVISSRFDVVLLSALRSPATTAAYDLALRAVEAPTFLVSVLGGPALFLFSRRIAAGDRLGVARAFFHAGRAFLLVSLPLSVVAAVLARPIVTTIFGARYHAAVVPLAILGGGLFLMFVTGLQGLLMVSLADMQGAVRLIGLVNLGGVVIQGTMIVSMGAVGAAVAIPVCQLGTLLLQSEFLNRHVGFRPLPRPPVRLLVACLATGAVAFALRDAALPVSVSACGITYLGFIWATGTVTADDVALLRRLAQRA